MEGKRGRRTGNHDPGGFSRDMDKAACIVGGTQEGMILELLKKGCAVTPADAFRMGITRLSGRVFDLRRKGWRISTERRKAKSGGMYAVYRLEGWPEVAGSEDKETKTENKKRQGNGKGKSDDE